MVGGYGGGGVAVSVETINHWILVFWSRGRHVGGVRGGERGGA